MFQKTINGDLVGFKSDSSYCPTSVKNLISDVYFPDEHGSAGKSGKNRYLLPPVMPIITFHGVYLHLNPAEILKRLVRILAS